MRIGTLTTGIGNFGKKGFYNTQEIGLGKELDKYFDEVIVYKAVDIKQTKQIELIDGCSNTYLVQIPVRRRGANGVWDCSELDSSLEALIYFSDTQISLPSVYKWCKRNGVKLFPYIGVTESHSNNAIIRIVMKMLFQRNLIIYKKLTCFVKTPSVVNNLCELGVNKTVVVPVGVDQSLLKKNYESIYTEELKSKYGYNDKDYIILFIGRMTEEKHPLRMIEIFRLLSVKMGNARLIMVGKGELLNRVKEAGKDLKIQFIDQIPNYDIWELYLISDAFINLNKQEIFGMSILEAMYYGCKVVAWSAPGPNSIIINGKNGWIVMSEEEVVDKILDNTVFNCKDYILNNYTWSHSASIMASTIKMVNN